MIVRRNEQVPILINILDFLFRNCILYALYIQIFIYTKIRHTIYLDRVTVTVPQILPF